MLSISIFECFEDEQAFYITNEIEIYIFIFILIFRDESQNRGYFHETVLDPIQYFYYSKIKFVKEIELGSLVSF